MALIHFVWIVLVLFPFPFPFLICKECVLSLYCLITWSFLFQILTSYIIFILSSAFFSFWNACVSLLKFTAFVLAYKIVAFILVFSLNTCWILGYVNCYCTVLFPAPPLYLNLHATLIFVFLSLESFILYHDPQFCVLSYKWHFFFYS